MMTIQTTPTIKTMLLLIAWLGFLSTGYSSETSEVKADLPKESVSFQVFSETPQDENLIEILEEEQTYNRIKKIIDTNFILTKPVRLHIQHPKPSQLIATELDQESHVVVLPFNFLHALYQGLSNKYEYQSDVINTIFSSTVEFYVWSEFADYLIKEKAIEIKGDTYTTKDNFASIMLLNQNNANSDFITDASEAYLLIHSNGESNISQHAQNELERDQQRYKHIICLTLGFHQNIQQEGIEADHLKSFAWNESDMAQCNTIYTQVLENWFAALSPSLHEKNLISHWLNLK